MIHLEAVNEDYLDECAQAVEGNLCPGSRRSWRPTPTARFGAGVHGALTETHHLLVLLRQYGATQGAGSCRMSQQKTIIDAMYDPDLFGPWHTPRKNWLRWEIVHRANYGLPIEAKDRAFYHKLFGPRRLPTAPATEGMAIAPRGSGKTQELAMEAVYASMLARLAIDSGSIPRRKVRGLLLSADREQTQESMDFCHMFTTESPLLRSLVTERTKTSVSFGPYVKLSVRTASDRSIRGPSAYFVGCDELPAWLPERAYKIPSGAPGSGEVPRLRDPPHRDDR